MTDRPTDRQAAERIAALLYDHREDALTCYDHGGYCCVCGVHDMAGYRWHLAEVIAADASSEADGLGGWWRDTPEARAALDEERLDLLLSEFYHSDDDDYVAALGDLKKFLATHVAAAREADRAEVERQFRELQSESRILPCDAACFGAPEEDCSRHGREPADLWRIIGEIQAQRDEAQEALARVEALHKPIRVYDECEHDADHGCEPVEVYDYMGCSESQIGWGCSVCCYDDEDPREDCPHGADHRGVRRERSCPTLAMTADDTTALDAVREKAKAEALREAADRLGPAPKKAVLCEQESGDWWGEESVSAWLRARADEYERGER